MRLSLFVPVYSATLLLSAALLFSVQPMFSKMILPLLGGTAQVWNTAMLFFQIVLLGGYAYAHTTTRFFNIKTQALTQIALLIIFLIVLPFGIPDGWTPPTEKDPTLWQLSLMAVTVGGPFFVLAGSAPIVQRWFAHTNHPDRDNPYFLYAASNLGSMTALLAYPFIIEPFLTLSKQADVWAASYGLLIALFILSAALIWPQGREKEEKETHRHAEIITWSRRGLWLVLAFIPSSLMLGVTTYVTVDVASVPLLWIMPLAIYVGTFIIVFARKQFFKPQKIVSWHALGIILLISILVSKFSFITGTPLLLIFIHLLLFFVVALSCHTELANSKPTAQHLTEFYLIMSAGGALGGFFNAIVAPVFFVIPLEYGLILGFSTFMRFASRPKSSFVNFKTRAADVWQDRKLAIFLQKNILFFTLALISIAIVFITQTNLARLIGAFVIAFLMGLNIDKRFAFATLACFAFILFPPGYNWKNEVENVVHRDRNFFGMIEIKDDYEAGIRLMLHGTTIHGIQALDERYKLIPFSYYNEKGALGKVYEVLENRETPQRLAVLGLGAGTLACYAKPGRHYDFFEIDPDVVDAAEDPSLFTYLSECGSPYDIVLGDARLTIAKKPDEYYDAIILDIFSSDNIPIHTITLEAIQTYLTKLKDDGILVFHISNRYLDIEPVLTNAARELDLHAYALSNRNGKYKDTNMEYFAAHFFIFVKSGEYEAIFKKQGWEPPVFREGVGLWTDDFSNIISVFGNRSGFIHMKNLDEDTKQSETAAEE